MEASVGCRQLSTRGVQVSEHPAWPAMGGTQRSPVALDVGWMEVAALAAADETLRITAGGAVPALRAGGLE